MEVAEAAIGVPSPTTIVRGIAGKDRASLRRRIDRRCPESGPDRGTPHPAEFTGRKGTVRPGVGVSARRRSERWKRQNGWTYPGKRAREAYDRMPSARAERAAPARERSCTRESGTALNAQIALPTGPVGLSGGRNWAVPQRTGGILQRTGAYSLENRVRETRANSTR